MSPLIRQWIALGVFGFFGLAALRPAVAAAAPAAPEATPPPAAAAPAPTPAPYPPTAPAGTPAPAAYPAPYYGQYPPPGYRRIRSSRIHAQYQAPPRQLVTEHRARKGLVIGGAVTFGVSWGLAASISLLLTDGSSCSGTCRDSAEVLWIPVAGPVLAGARDSDRTGPPSGSSGAWPSSRGSRCSSSASWATTSPPTNLAGRGGPTLHLAPYSRATPVAWR